MATANSDLAEIDLSAPPGDSQAQSDAPTGADAAAPAPAPADGSHGAAPAPAAPAAAAPADRRSVAAIAADKLFTAGVFVPLTVPGNTVLTVVFIVARVVALLFAFISAIWSWAVFPFNILYDSVILAIFNFFAVLYMALAEIPKLRDVPLIKKALAPLRFWFTNAIAYFILGMFTFRTYVALTFQYSGFNIAAGVIIIVIAGGLLVMSILQCRVTGSMMSEPIVNAPATPAVASPAPSAPVTTV